MPDQPPPSLEDLARAAVKAWSKWVRADAPAVDMVAAMQELERALDAAAARRPRASDYVLPVRLRVEKDFACALIASMRAWPENGQMCQAVVDKARHLARLLLDGPDAR